MRNEISLNFNEFENYFIVDSMPLKAAQLSRSSRSKETFYSEPNRGYCASQKMSYYGYKNMYFIQVEGTFKSLI